MAIRSRIGILTESPGHYERLTVRLNLEFFGRLHEVPDLDRQIGRYLDLLGLSDKAEAPAGTLSKGMKQKLAIARALLHEPPVLFLDEPTSALDPEASKTVRDFIESLRGQGRTIFLCTHNLDEAERLCDRIGVFRQRLIAVDTPEALRRQLFGRQTVVELAAGGIDHLAQAADAVGAAPGVQHVSWEGSPIGNGAGRLLITLEDPAAQNPAIVRALVALGVDVRFVSELHHSLEDIYLSLINEGGVPGGGRP
jgi:ABC-2 type transport system ATP-binding protein